MAGGNCSITWFDLKAESRFWAANSDIVSALELIDFTGRGSDELLVGSNDYCIRVFREEDCIAEFEESNKITFLSTMRDPIFGFSLPKACGVYNKDNLLWKEKTVNRVSALMGLDFEQDGTLELLVGY